MTAGTRTVVGLLGVMCCLAGLAEGKAEGDSRTIDLVDELSQTSAAIVTPSRTLFSRQNKWSGQGVPMTLTIAGHDVLARIDGEHFGIDANGDGAISTKERVPTRTKEELPFRIRIEDAPDGQKRYIGVIFKNVYGSSQGGFTGIVAPASCKMATIDGQEVRIYDDNMDGQYTVDGNDAIAIGESAKAAMPLFGVNKIGEDFFDVSIESDGSALTLTPIVEPATALVEMSTKAKGIVAFIVSDGAQACDLTQVSEILPGQYKLVYGMVSVTKSAPIMIVPTDMTVTYDVQADKTNELQVCEPLWIWYSGEMIGRKLHIRSTKIMGIGGEQYRVEYQRNTTPGKLALFKGKKVYIGGLVRAYSGSSFSFNGEANVDVPADAELLISSTVKGLGTAEMRTTVDMIGNRKCPINVAPEPVVYGVRY